MIATPLMAVIAGAIGAGYLIVAIFFFRFWTRTRDALFLCFAIAFVLIAIGHVLPILLGIPRESRSVIYLLRLSAFVLIIVAIAQKNLRRRRDSR